MSGFNTPITRLDPIWSTPHKEFSTTMTFEQMVYSLNDQFDLYDSINASTFEGLGNLDDLTTSRDSDFVVAINELDSDLWGAGGGNITDLLFPATSVGDALNQLAIAVGTDNPSFNPNIIGSVDSEFFILAGGPIGNDLNLISGNDVNIIAGDSNSAGNINLRGNPFINFENAGGVTKLQFDTSNANGAEIIGKPDVMMRGTDVYLAASNSIKLGGSLANPSTTLDFSDPTDTLITHGGSVKNIYTAGELTQRVDGGLVSYNDPNDDTRYSIDYSNATDVVHYSRTDAVYRADGTSTIRGTEVILQNELGVPYGGFDETLTGHLEIKSSGATAIEFGTDFAQFPGEIRLPATGTGSPPAEFITSVPGTVAVDQLLDALNNKVPLVYNRDGVVLNELELS